MSEEYKPAEGGFIKLIQLQRGGMLEEELDTAVQQMVLLCGDQAHLGKGKITVSLQIEKVAEHDGVFRVTEDVKIALPKLDRKPEIRFRTNTMMLTEDHQEQIKLFGDPDGGEIQKAGTDQEDAA